MESVAWDQWPERHAAVICLSDYLDEVLPHITSELGSTQVLYGAMALYRCNRYTRAIADATARGLGDTVGGNMRTLYETWLFGHGVLLSSDQELQTIQAIARGSDERAARAMGVDVTYPDDLPSSQSDLSIVRRARALSEKLEQDDPTNAAAPIILYETLFRVESWLGTHANLAGLQQPYAADPISGVIRLSPGGGDGELRCLQAAQITQYFARQVFQKAELSTQVLDEIGALLGHMPDAENP